MAHSRVLAYMLAVSTLVGFSSAAVCPSSCLCTTTPDGLHRAACSDLADLYKYTLRQKHHNINILDLSHNNITKITHELDRLTEVVTLDLSTNGLSEIGKFLHNAKKIVHLNLAHNRLAYLSLSALPQSISSLDLTNNLLQNVPEEIQHLQSLEHLEMEGNPLDCSCQNMKSRDFLISKRVLIDNVICVSPLEYKGASWLKLKTKNVCKTQPHEEFLDMMMGDDPMDAEKIGEESTKLKSMPMQVKTDLDEGETWDGSENGKEEDDESSFLKASSTVSPLRQFEGSGDIESTTYIETIERKSKYLDGSALVNDEVMLSSLQTTEDPLEGSGDEGSGFSPRSFNSFDTDDVTEDYILETTTEYRELNTSPITPFFGQEEADNDSDIPEYIKPKRPNIYMGPDDWLNTTNNPSTEKPVILHLPHDTTVSERIQISKNSEEMSQPSSENDKQTTHKTGTYVCIVIIVVLLVGLIGFAIVKGQMRKNRDRRLLRQQNRDVEKASKEMVDMNTSLLGKAAPAGTPERKQNGKYELVPTHETAIKSSENGDAPNGRHVNDYNQNKGSPRDKNQNREEKPNTIHQETDFDITPTSPDSKRDANSLSSVEFVPIIDDDTPHLNGTTESDVSQPLVNGDHTDSDFLSPSREYVPVYSPDMGRVRIKMTETPKPKTPILVTRSRSNAGDIIITPSGDGGVRKSTT